MLKSFFRIRLMIVLAILASLLGTALLLIIGTSHVIEAFLIFFGLTAPHIEGNESSEAVVAVIESLDSFLLAFVLIYFAYSTYFLFITNEQGLAQRKHVSMPDWMQVNSLGQMKRVLLEVIMVLIGVFFLKLVFTAQEDLGWTVIILPITMVAVAVSLKLVDFD